MGTSNWQEYRGGRCSAFLFNATLDAGTQQPHIYPLNLVKTLLIRTLALFLFALLSSPALALNATWNAATDVPVTAASYTASGTLNLTLNFAPPTGTNLTVVNNTGLGFISGTFSNLAQGQVVSLGYGGVTFTYVADYYGGTGNDLVLEWANRRTLAWGYNNEGELGSTSVPNHLVPNPVTATGVLLGKTVVALSAGQYHSIARCVDGTVATWGWNFYGQLGNNSNTTSYVPAAVNATSGVSALYGKTVVGVAAGAYHSVASCSDGTVAAWGRGGEGQLGNNATTDRSVPVAVITSGALLGKVVVGVAAGAYHTLALCSDGTVAAWGRNVEGQLGNNSTTSSSVPVAVFQASGALSGKTVIAIAAGSYHSLALCSDGTLAVWGYNGNGQLGNNNNSYANSSVPVLVNRASGVSSLFNKTVVKLVGLYSSSLAVCSDGTMSGWGSGSDGQLGNNSATGSLVPISVNTTSGVSALFGKTVTTAAGGSYHSLARCSDGTLAAWGANYDGDLGNNSTTGSTAPVSVSTTTLAAGEKWMSTFGGSSAYHSLGIVAAPPLPIVTTLAATSVTTTGAILNGSVNANGSTANVFFDYGAAPSYGINIPGVPTSVTGTSATSVSATLTSLLPGTTYHFRVDGLNPGGTSSGNDLTFTTNSIPIFGTKSVGPTGNYTSITAAIADVQAQGLGGALVLELQSTYVSTVETFPLTIPVLNGVSTVNTLTIRPALGATGLSISSAGTTAATVDLNGAQFVTIDGRPGGTGTVSQLSIANTSTSGVALRFINEASNNTVRYVALRSVNTSATSGTVVFSTTTGANGNDNNTIDHCDIRDGASTPTNGVYSLGTTTTTAANNSGNTLSNCNIFNFYAATAVDSAGVRLDGGSDGWSLTGNSFYQTVSRPAVGSATSYLPTYVRAIYVNNSSGNGFAVTNNSIGGSVAGAGGTAWTTTGTVASYQFVGVDLNVGASIPSSVQGNTVNKMVWTTASSVRPWVGILVEAGAVNVGTSAGNVIGSGTGTGAVSATTSSDGAVSYGILSFSPASVAVSNNTVGSIVTNATGASRASSLLGIATSGGASTISGNLVGSLVTANSLNAANPSTSTTGPFSGQIVTGIQAAGAGSNIVRNNMVANLNNNCTGALLAGETRGIRTSGGVNVITGNTVRNLITQSQNVSPFGPSVVGISQASASGGQVIAQNIVYALSNISATQGVKLAGIYYSGGAGGTNVVSGNFVHSLTCSSGDANSGIFGIWRYSGAVSVQNNMIRIGVDSSNATTASVSIVRGIMDGGLDNGFNCFFNTVYVCGTQTSGSSLSAAFDSSGGSFADSHTRLIRNNIFVNVRSNSGALSNHYAISSVGGGITASNNLFFTSGIGGVLGSYNSNDYTTLAAWQAATEVDAASTVADPNFIAPNGTAATVDLHIPANSPANNAGLALASVIDDFDGQPRSATTPAIGADEIPAANIAVAQSAALTDGVSSVDFGTVTLGSSSAARTFTITNPGTADLTGLAFSPKDGANAADFTVSALSGTSVPVGSGSVTFTVSFAPGAIGPRSAGIHIASNVSGAKNPFDIALTGTGQTAFTAAFNAWALANGVGSDPNALGANGQKNLVNFAFGIHPVTGTGAALQFNGTLAAGGTIGAVGLPVTWLESIANGVDFRALFLRRKDSAALGLTYLVEFSNASLGTWTASAAVPTVLADDGTYQIVSVPYPPFVAGKKTRFFRVTVSSAP